MWGVKKRGYFHVGERGRRTLDARREIGHKKTGRYGATGFL